MGQKIKIPEDIWSNLGVTLFTDIMGFAGGFVLNTYDYMQMAYGKSGTRATHFYVVG